MNKEIENCISNQIAGILDEQNKQKKQEKIDKLKKFVFSLWNVRENIQKDFISYNLLFSLHNYFKNENTNLFSKWIKIHTENRDVSINLIDEEISIFNIDMRKTVDIKIQNELSDELYDFICKFFNYNIKLDLEKLENEKIENIENDIDLSGI